LIERYRVDYPGEFVITNITIRKGKKEETREWIANPIVVNHVSERATCIAYSPDIKDSLYERIQKNNGGNLGKLRMQVYGDESVWEKLEPNFLVSYNTEILENMIKHGYTQKTIIYTSSSKCIKYPGEFYLMPQSISLQPQPASVWLACFDGHKEIYMVGFDDDGSTIKQKMINSVATIMRTYRDVKFIQVTDIHSHDTWKKEINFESMDFNTYISHCDV